MKLPLPEALPPAHSRFGRGGMYGPGFGMFWGEGGGSAHVCEGRAGWRERQPRRCSFMAAA